MAAATQVPASNVTSWKERRQVEENAIPFNTFLKGMLLLLLLLLQSCLTVQPYRWQPPRLPRPWDSPVKNTGVGCHFLLQCMKVKSESEVTQSCPTPSDPIDCGLPGSSVHGIFQARVLEWGAIAFSVIKCIHTTLFCISLAII